MDAARYRATVVGWCHMRLTGTIYTLNDRCKSISIKIAARDIPGGAAITVTDIQLQPGEHPSGIVGNPRETGATVGGLQWRSGVVNGDTDLVLVANPDRTSPTRLELEGTYGTVRVGAFRFGRVSGSAVADGENHAATQGHGRVPLLTERCDLTVPVESQRRAHLRVCWTDREY